jgi:hypothetical protein
MSPRKEKSVPQTLGTVKLSKLPNRSTSDFVQRTLNPYIEAFTDWNKNIVEFLQGQVENPLVTLEERVEYYHDSISNLRWVFITSASTYSQCLTISAYDSVYDPIFIVS